MFTLEVKKRDSSKTLSKLRQDGIVPAVFYGRKEKSTPIAIAQKEFLKVWKLAGESSVVTLKGDIGEEKQSLIEDVQRDPVTGVPIHADFYVFEKDHRLKIKVPIEFAGEAPAVKDLGGILVKVMHELEIESLPKDLPHTVSIDISALVDFKSQMLAKDIKLPTGVTLISLPEDVVAAVTQPRVEEEKPPEAIDLSSIEVEKKGKEAIEGEAGEEVTVAPEGAKKESGKKEGSK